MFDEMLERDLDEKALKQRRRRWNKRTLLSILIEYMASQAKSHKVTVLWKEVRELSWALITGSNANPWNIIKCYQLHFYLIIILQYLHNYITILA